MIILKQVSKDSLCDKRKYKAMNDKIISSNENPIETGLVNVTDPSGEAFGSFITDDVLSMIKEKEFITVLGSKYNNTACGALAGYLDDDIFFIASLYVAPDFRLMGIGEALIDHLKRLMPEGEPIRIDVPFDVKNDYSDFLINLDFIPYDPVDAMYFVPVSALLNSHIFSKPIHSDVPILCFSECSDQMQRNIRSIAVTDNAIVPGELVTPNAIDNELSFVSMDGDSINALLLAETEGDITYITGLYSENSKILYGMLQMAAAKALLVYQKKDHMLYIPVTNSISKQMVLTLFPEADQAVFSYIYIPDE